MERQSHHAWHQVGLALSALADTHEANEQKDTVPFWYAHEGKFHIAVHSDTVQKQVMALLLQERFYEEVDITLVKRSSKEIHPPTTAESESEAA